jgi:hypothetical protein
MRFLNQADCRVWFGKSISALGADGWPVRPNASSIYAQGPTQNDYAFCQQLESALQPRDSCLLWVTTWGVWGSSENLHLYYRLRQSYGDLALLQEAPGHLFLKHESADLISFLQVGILCGWDMHLLPIGGYSQAFVSHDEFVEFAADEHNASLTREFAAKLGGAEIRENK